MSSLVAVRRHAHDLRMLGPSTLWAFVFFWTALISWLSAQPSHKDDPSGAAAHLLFNSGHAPLFGFWASGVAFAIAAAVRRPLPDTGHCLMALAATALFGAVDEVHQSYVPGRTSSWTDIVTDLVGAAISLAILRYVASSKSTRLGLLVAILAGLASMIGAGALATAVDRM
ncbi:MAG: VanZ family protein [Planctomycetes bacterium]|nr:VanZ family protein [Planctomycetota bacterium]